MDPNQDPDPSDPYVFGLLNPDPDSLVRGVDPDPSIILLFCDFFFVFC